MRKAYVFYKGEPAGLLKKNYEGIYEFEYFDDWVSNESNPSISLTLPKSKRKFKADYLFPFFFNMLSEGINKEVQCKYLKIDENDYFGLLLATASNDTIGAVTVKPAENLVNEKD